MHPPSSVNLPCKEVKNENCPCRSLDSSANNRLVSGPVSSTARLTKKMCNRTNPGFESYLAKIGEDIAIELMSKPGLQAVTADNNHAGWVHLAISVGGAQRRSMRWPGRQKPEVLVSRRARPATALLRSGDQRPGWQSD